MVQIVNNTLFKGLGTKVERGGESKILFQKDNLYINLMKLFKLFLQCWKKQPTPPIQPTPPDRPDQPIQPIDPVQSVECGYLYAGQRPDDFLDTNNGNWYIMSPNVFNYRSVRFDNPMMWGAGTDKWGWQIDMLSGDDMVYPFPLYFNAGVGYDLTNIAGYLGVNLRANSTADNKFTGSTLLILSITLEQGYRVVRPDQVYVYVTTSSDFNIPFDKPSDYTMCLPFNPSESPSTTTYYLHADTDLFYTDVQSTGNCKKLLQESPYTARPKFVVYVGGIGKL